MSRLTPYDLAFAGDVEGLFTGVQAEASAAMKDATDMPQFVSLPSVQRIVSRIESPELLKANPAAAAEYHVLLYTAFRFWTTGKTVIPTGREILENSKRALTRDVQIRPPGGACYVQLPEHWIWAQVDADSAHEPIDGLFVAQSAEEAQITIVAVLGLREEREGFTQISISVAKEELTDLAEVVGARPFEPVMDGGLQAGFKSVTSLGELLLLTHLALAHVQS
jgi:hypothetical protein